MANVNTAFVRAAFYIKPPSEGATQEEWEAWLEADDKSASTAKGQHTRSLENGDLAVLPDYLNPDFSSSAKVNGRWSQGAITGFSGEEGNVTRDVAVDSGETQIMATEERKKSHLSDRGLRSLSRNQRKTVAKIRAQGGTVDWSRIEAMGKK